MAQARLLSIDIDEALIREIDAGEQRGVTKLQYVVAMTIACGMARRDPRRDPRRDER